MFAKERTWTPSRISQMLSSGSRQPTTASRRRGRPATRDRDHDHERVESVQPSERGDVPPHEEARRRLRSETSPLARSPYITVASGSTRKRRRIEYSADETPPTRHERTPSPGHTPRVRRPKSIYVDDTHDAEDEETAVMPRSRKGKEPSKRQTSQHTRRGKRATSRVRDDADGDSRDPHRPRRPTTCDWCYTDLSGKTRHRCRACDFNLCSDCAINASVVYEEHEGHECEVIAPDSSTAGNTAAPTPTPTISEPTRHVACSVCQVELRGLRWECEQCPDVHLCEDDRKLHIVGHLLRAVDPKPAPDTGNRRPKNTRENAAPRQEQRGHETGRLPRGDTTPRIILNGTSSNARGQSGVRTLGDIDATDGSGEDIGRDEDAVDEHEGNGVAESNEGGGRAGREDTSTAAFPRYPRRRRRTTIQQQQPTHITITVPIEGYTVFAIWARAILDQAPDIPLPLPRVGSSEASSRVRTHRRWLPEDNRRLRELKAEGKTDEQVALSMGRTAGAVGQQWRKLQSE